MNSATGGLQTLLYRYCLVDDRRVRRLLRLWFTVGAATAMGAMGERHAQLASCTLAVVITVYLTRTLALVLWTDVLRARDVVVSVNASIDVHNGYSATTATRQYDGLVPVIPGAHFRDDCARMCACVQVTMCQCTICPCSSPV